MTGTNIIIAEEGHETKEQQRKRLAIELRAVQQQHNSKLLELLDTGVEVTVNTNGAALEGEEALIGTCDISYQTKPKHY